MTIGICHCVGGRCQHDYAKPTQHSSSCLFIKQTFTLHRNASDYASPSRRNLVIRLTSYYYLDIKSNSCLEHYYFT